MNNVNAKKSEKKMTKINQIQNSTLQNRPAQYVILKSFP